MKDQDVSDEIITAEEKEINPDAVFSKAGSAGNSSGCLPETGTHPETEPACIYPPPYTVIDGCLFVKSVTKSGTVTKRLCNFTPRLISEITHDDGAAIMKRLRLGGEHAHGYPLHEIEISGGELSNFNWLLDNWGADCNIDVGGNVKENIRYAIQSTSKSATHETVYSVTGWKKVGGEWHFLMPDSDALTVELGGKLKRYSLKSNYSANKVLSAALILEVPFAPKEIVFSLLSFVFLSPLNEFLRQAGIEPKTVLMLTGKTGAKKSTLAALMLSFFGNFTASDLPLSFRDTGNSIIHHTFALKDVLTCIDDFHPCGKLEEGKLTATAQSIMRAYGDRVGRGRLKADSSPIESRPPQGNAIITAEFAPDIGESGTARYFSLELKQEGVDLGLLSTFQDEARKGAFVACMAEYLKWIKSVFLTDSDNEKKFILILREVFFQRRDEFKKRLSKSEKKCHDRIPEAASWMQLGFTMFLRFLKAEEMITDERMTELDAEFTNILLELASQQSDSIEQDKPTHKFIRKLFSLLESGQAVVIRRDLANQYLPVGFVGYEDDQFYYLSKDISHKAVKRLCEEQGEAFSISSNALVKALAEENLIEVARNGERTKSLRVGDKYFRMLYLIKNKANAIGGASVCK